MGLRAKRLKGLRIEESSGVDHPAHQAEGWMVLKAEDGELFSLDDETLKAFNPAMVAGMLRGALASMPTEAKAHAKALIAALGGKPAKKGADVADDDTTPTAEEFAAMKARAEKAEADLATATKATGGDDATELTKALESLPEPVRKAWEANEARVAKAEATATDAVTKAEVERNARLDADYVVKARADFPHLPIKAEVLGPILRSVDEGTPLTEEQRGEWTRVMRAAADVERAGALFKSIGTGGSPDAESPYGQIVAKAVELQTASATTETPLSREQAIAKASELHPELVAAHRATQRAGNGARS